MRVAIVNGILEIDGSSGHDKVEIWLWTGLFQSKLLFGQVHVAGVWNRNLDGTGGIPFQADFDPTQISRSIWLMVRPASWTAARAMTG